MSRPPQTIIERRTPWWLPIIAVIISVIMLGISACSMVLGPAFGAAVAVVGNYVTSSTRSAVMENRLSSIESKVDRLVESNEKRLPVDGKIEVTVADHTHKIEVLEARAAKQETQYAEVLGSIRKK